MKTHILLLITLVSISAHAQGTGTLPPDQRTRFDIPDTTKMSRAERAIIRIELSRSPAIARNDSATLRRIYSRNFRGVTAIGTQVDREQLLAVFSRDDGSTHFLIDQIDITNVGTAMVYSGRLSTFAPNDSLLGRSVFMHVYQYLGGRWQIVRAQGTLQRTP